MNEFWTMDARILFCDQCRDTPLAAGEVLVAVAAVGLNFRDVLNVLGMYPGDPGDPGGDCAGTVLAVGNGVQHLSPGVFVTGYGEVYILSS